MFVSEYFSFFSQVFNFRCLLFSYSFPLPFAFSLVSVSVFLFLIMPFLNPLILDMLTHFLFNRIFDSIQVKLNALSHYICANRNSCDRIPNGMEWNGVCMSICMQEWIFCEKLYICIKFTYIKTGKISSSKSQMIEIKYYLRHNAFLGIFDWKTKSVCWFSLVFLLQFYVIIFPKKTFFF